MHPLNVFLSRFGFRVARTERMPSAFRRRFRAEVRRVQEMSNGVDVFVEPHYDVGSHPSSYLDAMCQFAARHVLARAPATILDIGSDRHFVIGLLAHYPVTTVDVRERPPIASNETVIIGDAKRLQLPADTFDVVMSLSAIEHFGLGRYGDEFDPQADGKAVAEMARVLKPGGRLILATTVTRSRPAICFNAHRIYTCDQLRALCARLELLEESFFSNRLACVCGFADVTEAPGAWDAYLGCWQK